MIALDNRIDSVLRSSVRGAIVASGTSSFVVLDGYGQDEAGPEALIRALFTGNGQVGLGGSHYQSNKVVMLWPADHPHQFYFRFFQYEKSTGRVLADMECSNGAAGAAAYAVAIGHVLAQADGSVWGHNLGTGQEVMLCPNSGVAFQPGPWTVRFMIEDLTLADLPERPELLVSDDGQAVEYWPLAQSNGFLFTHVVPDEFDAQFLVGLGTYGGQSLHALGMPEEKSTRPKLIFYSVNDVVEETAELDSACFYHGERHRSLPGSGAMYLAAFLTLKYLAANTPDAPMGERTYRMNHGGGQIEVSAHWVAEDGGYRILSTAFETSVALLLLGAFPIPNL